MNLLVVYNICGIRNEDVSYYSLALSSILQQKNIEFKTVVSGCMTKYPTKRILQNLFDNRISYNWIDEVLPVNVTFNHTVREAVKIFGEFDAYLYIDSGINLSTDKNILSKAYTLYTSGPYAMVSVLADNDNAIQHILGYEGIPSENTLVPVGCSVNCHVQLFSNDLFKTYDRRLMPDIFASSCTESVFSFLCAAIQKQWIILGNDTLPHIKSMDGASSGFPNIHPWDHTFRAERSMSELIRDVDGIRLGFGYEECGRILMHDPNCYDNNGLCTNNELASWLTNNIFLPSRCLDYDHIKSELII